MDRIGRLLNKYNIQTVFKPLKKIGQILRNPKDQRPQFCMDIQNTLLLWKSIGETGRMVNTRMKEHQRDVRLKHIIQSALSERNIETSHQILFDKTTTIVTTTLYFPRKYREAIEIQKHPDNLNRDNSYNISKNPFFRLSKIDRLVNLKK